eukprot:GHVT01105657.1.p1 GENE.GHVT01105657.1~~GHVT01105657.1.p1  ORF type:complete len:164 (+),score=31.89 GHVT01105657.1:166-657(+)
MPWLWPLEEFASVAPAVAGAASRLNKERGRRVADELSLPVGLLAAALLKSASLLDIPFAIRTSFLLVATFSETFSSPASCLSISLTHSTTCPLVFIVAAIHGGLSVNQHLIPFRVRVNSCTLPGVAASPFPSPSASPFSSPSASPFPSSSASPATSSALLSAT